MKSFIWGMLTLVFMAIAPSVSQATTNYPWEYRYENCSTATDGTDHSFCVDSASYQLFKCSTAGGTCNTLVSNRPNIITVTQSATPTINVTNANRAVFSITGLAQPITSITIAGTPINGEIIEVQITDNGTSQSISWGSGFASSSVTLPSVTVPSTMISVVLQYDSASSLWICKGKA